MQVFDDEHRDIIPVGSRLRQHINKYHELGVVCAGDYGEESDRMDLDVEWKNVGAFFALSSSPVWQTLGMTIDLPRGFGMSGRVGRKVRVMGIQLSLQVALLARHAGEQLSVPGTGNFTTSDVENGPGYFRIMLVVAKVNDPAAGSYPNIFTQTGFPCAQFQHGPFENYRCIFDKMYVLPAAGGKILDNIYIDCDFIQQFEDDALPTATHNFIECRYFLDPAEGIHLPTGRMDYDMYFEDV